MEKNEPSHKKLVRMSLVHLQLKKKTQNLQNNAKAYKRKRKETETEI